MKLKLRLPPSGLRPEATAIASSNVDFPEPFSPITNVTGCSNRNSSSCPIAGMVNGNASSDGILSRKRRKPIRKLRACQGGRYLVSSRGKLRENVAALIVGSCCRYDRAAQLYLRAADPFVSGQYRTGDRGCCLSGRLEIRKRRLRRDTGKRSAVHGAEQCRSDHRSGRAQKRPATDLVQTRRQ